MSAIDDVIQMGTDDYQERAWDDWNRAVDVEAKNELRAERFREEVNQRKEQLHAHTFKNRIINWIRAL